MFDLQDIILQIIEAILFYIYMRWQIIQIKSVVQ